MIKLIRNKKALELYLKRLEIDMANIIDDIKETKKIDKDYYEKINMAHDIVKNIQGTKFEISLLNIVTNKNKKEAK